MMRLIDADALKKDANDDLFDCPDTVEEVYWNDGAKSIIDLIKTAPTIEAVPVVRCKDCKWWDKIEDSPFGYCMAMKHGYMSTNWEIGIYRRYKGDFYCADAKKSKQR